MVSRFTELLFALFIVPCLVASVKPAIKKHAVASTREQTAMSFPALAAEVEHARRRLQFMQDHVIMSDASCNDNGMPHYLIG